ncbi:hypothetical protein EV685_0073 [Sphaerotilus mobilis]|uniref:Uncharacterized protein n=2 Tax=Sphaerotilus mobilis TaxID=47994 RepID=A0A4Q7LU16_9BURK|nr:hypothetical protein EV685_0073 [Sphaerotilus mobilis]
MDEVAPSAGLPRAAYLVGLLAQVPILVIGGRHAESVAALVRANSERVDFTQSFFRHYHVPGFAHTGRLEAGPAVGARSR